MFDEHIVEVQYNDDVVVSKKDVSQLYELLDAVTENRPYAKLLIIGSNTIITEDARTEVINANKIRKDSVLAEAIVVRTLAQRIKTNIYMKFVSAYYPTQCFDSQEKAVHWLAKYNKPAGATGKL